LTLPRSQDLLLSAEFRNQGFNGSCGLATDNLASSTTACLHASCGGNNSHFLSRLNFLDWMSYGNSANLNFFAEYNVNVVCKQWVLYGVF
jgi:hypothetical protein